MLVSNITRQVQVFCLGCAFAGLFTFCLKVLGKHHEPLWQNCLMIVAAFLLVWLVSLMWLISHYDNKQANKLSVILHSLPDNGNY
ncbi:MAG: hypothetical protein WCV73_04610 [Patescibacteria group bacterium]|jgi:hypothetical protein